MRKRSPSPEEDYPDTRPRFTWSHEQEAQALYKALYLLGSNRQAEAVLNCHHIVYEWRCYECGHMTLIPYRCGLRLCPKCAVHRSNHFIASHRTALTAITEPKLLTLTWRSFHVLTKESVSNLTEDFSTLRHTQEWQENVRGGIAGTEFTYAEAGWHPHIHALLDSAYYSVKPLRDAWKRITHGSYIVDIRQIATNAGVMEVAKYAAKGSTFYRDKELVAQFLDATHKRRFYTSFGTLYNSTDPKPPRPADAPEKPIDPATGLPQWNIPAPNECEKCHSTALSYQGEQRKDEPEAPAVQIPF